MMTLSTMISALRTRARDSNGKYLTDALATDYLNEASRQWARRTSAITKIKGFRVIPNKKTYKSPRGLLRPLWMWDLRTPRRIYATPRTKPAEPWLPVWHIVSSGLTWWFYVHDSQMGFLPKMNFSEPQVNYTTAISASALSIPNVSAPISNYPRFGRLLLVENTPGNVNALADAAGFLYPSDFPNAMEEVVYETVTDNGNGTITFSNLQRGAGDTTAQAFTNTIIVRLSMELHYIGMPRTLSALTDVTDVSDNDLEAVYAYACFLAFSFMGKRQDAQDMMLLFNDFVAQKMREQRSIKTDMNSRLNWGDGEYEMRTVI